MPEDKNMHCRSKKQVEKLKPNKLNEEQKKSKPVNRLLYTHARYIFYMSSDSVWWIIHCGLSICQINQENKLQHTQKNNILYI